MADVSHPISIVSPADGSRQEGMLRLPSAEAAAAIPVVIAPHPITWTVEQDYFGGEPFLKREAHLGWKGVADLLNVAVLQPAGHHREVPDCSLGYPPHIADVPAWIDATERLRPVDRRRIYACGLSMGGQEALLIAARHPDLVAACVAFNPIVDLAAWQEDLAATTNAELYSYRMDEMIAQEVGGSPSEVPELYAERGVFGALGGLRQVPAMIWWSRHDILVSHQIERHGKRLYDALKAEEVSAPVCEYEHTTIHGLREPLSDDDRWRLHEFADYDLATRWLLLHSKPSV